MSDDEWEYDDEDIFWIEEPDPTLADDLAEATTYDALYFDDPSLDVEDIYSDWDEMSDDYYDDDPTEERRRRVLNAIKSNENGAAQTQKSLVRQPSRQVVAGDLPRVKTDHTSFQAVVWRTLGDEKDSVDFYEPGDGEKVALLKNWREVFRNSHPVIDRLRLRKMGHLASDTDRSRPRIIDDLLQREAQKEDSSDSTSGITSLDALRETDAGSDNTLSSTPLDAESPAPPHIAKVIDSASTVLEIAHDRLKLDDLEMGDSANEVDQPLSPAKGNRKRKASESVGEGPDKAVDHSKRLKPQNHVVDKPGRGALPAQTRSSTRQKANQK
ncbi:uncharacterized protein ACLA_011630 [Aspergillus clavatus NRRL 1]|uniref:Uncharacterized protein n=1 Tax=Aspergillus clavatus (strain ATCC 1007 / CBS 513.65 / DSM 816 / NCTC 3887 / NRRL 1 / QM 1276 / 107) TaxID=344612 RepID=A1CAG8_ASPCL|nr:uncharacterized protein ACLA_011630 [Aspergillus clavatus NRRL 1]EAW12736.1 conserved hypothetical protein [Aspergillus clavatus NRRL 1]